MYRVTTTIVLFLSAAMLGCSDAHQAPVSVEKAVIESDGRFFPIKDLRVEARQRFSGQDLLAVEEALIMRLLERYDSSETRESVRQALDPKTPAIAAVRGDPVAAEIISMIYSVRLIDMEGTMLRRRSKQVDPTAGFITGPGD